jgi:mono/diheme cytochrome c family protein
MKRFSKTTKALTIAALSALSLVATMPTATAQVETGDRPEIKIPRGGGRAAFEKHLCITCHMPDGRGGQNEGGYGADLRVTPLTEDQIVWTIKEGRTAKGMPSFKGQIDDETIRMLAEFIKRDLALKK